MSIRYKISKPQGESPLMRQVKNNLASLTLRAKGRGSKDFCFPFDSNENQFKTPS